MVICGGIFSFLSKGIFTQDWENKIPVQLLQTRGEILFLLRYSIIYRLLKALTSESFVEEKCCHLYCQLCPLLLNLLNVSSKISAGGKNKVWCVQEHFVSFLQVVTFRHLSFWPRQSRRQPVCLLHHQLKVAWPSARRHKTRLAVSCLYSADKKILHDLSHQLMKADEIRQEWSWPWGEENVTTTPAKYLIYLK